MTVQEMLARYNELRPRMQQINQPGYQQTPEDVQAGREFSQLLAKFGSPEYQDQVQLQGDQYVAAQPASPAGTATMDQMMSTSASMPGTTSAPVTAGKTGQGGIMLKMPNGSTGFFTDTNDPALDQALRSGAKPLGPNGEELELIPDVHGGYLVKVPGEEFGVPLNVAMGGDFQEGQLEALGQYYSSNGATPQSYGDPGNMGVAQTQYPKTSNTLIDPWTSQFNYDPSSLREAPGYQFQLQEGLKALDRMHSAGGSLDSGARLKDILGYSQGLADQNYRWDYGRQLGEYEMGRDEYFANQDRPFNKLQATAGMGQVAGTNLGNFGAQYAANAGNTIMGGVQQQGNYLTNAADARASGYVGAQNARQPFDPTQLLLYSSVFK